MFKPTIDWVVYDLVKMQKGRLLLEAVSLFLYDTIKIFLLRLSAWGLLLQDIYSILY
ncbi:MAG: hypothetical protein WCY09_04645 [Candidatus Omnitrophota bacterium]